MRLLRTSILMAAAVLLAYPGFADDKLWKEVRSPHFRVITDGSERDARHVARAFEQMRSTFANQFPGFRIDAPAPLLILAPENESTAKMLLPEFWQHEGPKPAGLFLHGWEVEHAIVRLDTILSDQRNPDTFNVVYHEYVHSLLHLNFRWLPTWLDEGLAEFYGFTRFEGGKTFIGAPPRNGHYLDVLYRRPAMPLATFLEQRGSFLRDEGDTHLFYAQCWTLTHFLTMGPGMDGGDRLKRFFNALLRGTEQKKAFQEAFGDFPTVQKDFENYLNRFAFTAGVVDNIPQVDEGSFSSRTMSLAETKTGLGSFFAATRKWKESRELAEAAVASDPKLASAHELLGFIDLNDGKDQEALKEFSMATDLDGHLYRSLFAKTMLSPLSPSKSAADREAFRSALTKVLELNPEFAPASVELAKFFVAQGDLTRALALARTAEKNEPSRAGYHVLTGQILLRMGHPSEAATHAAYVATRWRFGPDHDEAMELWSQVPAAQRPVEDLPVEIVVPDVHIAEGLVKSVACDDKGIIVTLEQAGQTLTFHARGMMGYSDTFWEGHDHFTPCFHNVGARGVIRYKTASDKSFTGDALSIGFRDDLPPTPTTSAEVVPKSDTAHQN
jgi:tetratricopeptide (TPR) repeat protein